MARRFVCMFLLLMSQVQSQDGCDIPLILWTDGCNQYNNTPALAGPRAKSISHTFSSTFLDCLTNCNADRRCGGWSFGGPNQLQCKMFNMNDEIINQYLTDNSYLGSANFTWNSKTCPYDIGATDLTCNIYTTTVPSNTYISSWYMWIGDISDVTATHCHTMCTLYTACKSVTFIHYTNNGRGLCHLYDTTVEELSAAGQHGSVLVNTDPAFTYTNYNRFCTDGSPYMPVSSCPTTTTIPTTTIPTTTTPTTTIPTTTIPTTTTPPTTISTTTEPSDGGSPGEVSECKTECLYGDDAVLTQDGVSKKVKDIVPGDKVMVVDDEGSIQFQTMYIDIHHNPNKQNVQFVRIKTNNNLTITVTPKHLMYSGNGLVAAEKIKIGDPVITYDKSSTALGIEHVTDISQVIHDGVYNPLVQSGRVLVSHILASTYPDMAPFTAQHQHYILWPVRQILAHFTGSQFIANILMDKNWYQYTNYLLENIVLVVFDKMFL